MKKLVFRSLLFIAGALMLMLPSCRNDSGVDDSASAEDAVNMSAALSSATDDASNAISTTRSLSGKTNLFESICGASASIDSARGVGTITYSGTECSGRWSRTGTVTVTLLNYAHGVRWSDENATLELDFDKVTFTNNLTSAEYILSGTHYLVNVTGGLAYKIMDGTATGTVIHKQVTDNFSITFPNGEQRTWNVRRSRRFTNTGGVNTIVIDGDTMINGEANTDMWGTNRAGETFVNAIIDSLVGNGTCGYLRPVSGQFFHHIANRTAVILFGVDTYGNPVTAASCAYGYLINYSKGTRTGIKTYTAVVRY